VKRVKMVYSLIFIFLKSLIELMVSPSIAFLSQTFKPKELFKEQFHLPDTTSYSRQAIQQIELLLL
jgi:hypothetical protein